MISRPQGRFGCGYVGYSTRREWRRRARRIRICMVQEWTSDSDSNVDERRVDERERQPEKRSEQPTEFINTPEEG